MQPASILVPRIFHRIWLGGKPLPKEFAEWGETWLTHHPGWRLKTWNEHTIPDDPKLRERLARGTSFSEQSDILRYEIVLRYGGVYIDTDFECRKNIEGAIAGYDFFAAYQSDDPARPLGSINGAFFGAAPDHPLLQALVDDLDKPTVNVAGVGRWGPNYFTEHVKHYPGVKIFPRASFYPYDWTEAPDTYRSASDFPQALAVHHWSSDWYKP